jgi:hypothetical protein
MKQSIYPLREPILKKSLFKMGPRKKADSMLVGYLSTLLVGRVVNNEKFKNRLYKDLWTLKKQIEHSFICLNTT